MATHPWQFKPSFRRHAFGWRSATPIKRIKEAVSEIKQVARQQPVVAAEGAVILLEKLSPALEHVDSSSGSLGSAVNKAIEMLVPVIAAADVDPDTRQHWLDRLWQAVQEDAIPYIERLGDYWGQLCVTPQLASNWADRFRPPLEQTWQAEAAGFRYFKGTSACLASLLAAGRNQEVLDLLEQAPFKWWYYRRWGVKALVAMGQKAEAVRYAEASRGLNDPEAEIAAACEAILLSSGLADEAYSRYALQANVATTHLATFRAIAKKYAHKPREMILRDLVASTPGAEGKWFAAAKHAELFGLATELAGRSPTDPRTLTRAAREFAERQPAFALTAAMLALHWIACGYGYEISTGDVVEAFEAALQTAPGAGLDGANIREQVRQIIATGEPGCAFIEMALARRLT